MLNRYRGLRGFFAYAPPLTPLCRIYLRSRIKVAHAFAEGRRQVRKGIRGRIVTAEVRQASKVTIVSIAGTERRPETRNLPP